MSNFDVTKGLEFVRNLDLGVAPRRIVTRGAEAVAGEVFDAATSQARVVGSGLLAFEAGVTPEVRKAVSNSALLAQLVANKKAKGETDPLVWFREYANVLQNLGWTVQDQGWTDYTTKGKAAEVHEKILEVAAAAIAGGPALAIITASVNALKGMQPGSSWLTIFNRESQKANLARFQVGLVSNDPAGDIFVSLVACLIQAESNITQVLFFKYREAQARFQANDMKVTVNRDSMTNLAGAISEKTLAFQHDYLSSIGNLDV